jgi:hypothetical protein
MVTYDAELLLPSNAAAAGIPPPMKVADASNYDVPSDIMDAGLDFTGLWWMMGNPVHEEIVSFAGTYTVSTDGGFPVTLKVPNSGQGTWSWPMTAQGIVLSKYYSIFDPTAYTDFNFDSGSYGEVETGLDEVPLVWVESFPFIRLGPDEWLRPTYFQHEPWPRGQSPWPQTNYTLVRIVNSTGAPHPTYWPLFLQHMQEQYVPASVSAFTATTGVDSFRSPALLRSKATDDWCQLKCQIFLPCASCLTLCSYFS